MKKEHIKGDTVECFYQEESCKGFYLGYDANHLLRVIEYTGECAYVFSYNNDIKTCRMILSEKKIKIKSVTIK